MHKILTVFIFGIISCSRPDVKRNEGESGDNLQVHYIHSELKAVKVGDNYVFCDTSLKGELSCFAKYNGVRYLKKEKIFFDSSGRIVKLAAYKPEGVIEYTQKNLMEDSVFLKTNSLLLNGNLLRMKSDSIISPIVGKITEFDRSAKKIYALFDLPKDGVSQLYVFEYW